MAKKYTVQEITQSEKDELLDAITGYITNTKAEIHGLCVELITENKNFKEMWEDNFYGMSDTIRPHCRIVAMNHDNYPETTVLYEQISKTVFLYNCTYYGYVKSLALAVAGDFLEDYHSIHSRFSVHGACIDFSGRGMAIIAPSGSGKTTLSYGLLLEKKSKLVSDDWFYVQPTLSDVVAYCSEKNNYIRDDIGDNWEIFKTLVDNADLDPQRRAVVDLSLAIGKMKTRQSTILKDVVLLKRENTDPKTLTKLTTDDALQFLIDHDFCNPHQLIRTDYKMKLRRDFFKKMLENVNIFLLNTAHEGPDKSKLKLLEIVKKDIS